MHSAHEGHSVIEEEFDELWDDIKEDAVGKSINEARQVAAMACRYLFDIGQKLRSGEIKWEKIKK